MNKITTEKSSNEDVSFSGPLLIPIKEGRRLLGGIGNSKFYEEVAIGRLKLVKMGRRSFLTPGEIRRYVAALQEGT